VGVASAVAPVPRYRDFSVPQKLVNLRMTTTVTSGPATQELVARAASGTLVSSVAAGSQVTFIDQLVNDTSDPSQAATGVVIQSNLPAGLTLISCSSSGASCGGTGNQVQVTYGTLGAGQTVTVTVVAGVDASLPNGTVVDDTASAASDEVNQDPLAAMASTSFVVLNGVPVVVGETPAAGSGLTGSFQFQFSHPAGYQNLGVVNVLINNFLDGRNACYLAYSVPASTLYLVDDGGHAGGPFAGSVPLGSSSVIQNSQCAVSLVSAVGNGTTLTLTLSITFQAAFGGNKIAYVAARDQGGQNSNWQALGVWQVPFTAGGSIGVTGMTPARGAKASGTNQQFQFSLTDAKGTGDFGVVNVLVNGFLDGRHACYLAYVAASNMLYLVDDGGDAGGPFAGSMAVNGGNGGIQNSQCAVSGAGSAVGSAANTLTLTLNLTFTGPFSGNRVVYVAGRDQAGGNNTGWQAMGTWTVQ